MFHEPEILTYISYLLYNILDERSAVKLLPNFLTDASDSVLSYLRLHCFIDLKYSPTFHNKTLEVEGSAVELLPISLCGFIDAADCAL